MHISHRQVAWQAAADFIIIFLMQMTWHRGQLGGRWPVKSDSVREETRLFARLTHPHCNHSLLVVICEPAIKAAIKMHMLASDLAVLLVVFTSVKEHNNRLLQRTNFSKCRLFCFIILPHFMSHWLPSPLVVLSLVQSINRHLAWRDQAPK